MKRAWMLLLVVVGSTACTRSCSRSQHAPALTLTVLALEHDQNVVASKTTVDPVQVAIVTEAIRVAETTEQLRCTFLEGGEPRGLRFDLSDRRRVYVFATRGIAMREGACWTVDATSTDRLHALARTLDVSEPPRKD
jgi:hypothetical protein